MDLDRLIARLITAGALDVEPAGTLTRGDADRLTAAGWAREVRIGARTILLATGSGRQASKVGPVAERHARITERQR